MEETNNEIILDKAEDFELCEVVRQLKDIKYGNMSFCVKIKNGQSYLITEKSVDTLIVKKY